MHPDCDERNDTNDVRGSSRAALRITMQFVTELGKVGKVAWPRERKWQGPEAQQNKCSGNWEEDDDEEDWCVDLRTSMSDHGNKPSRQKNEPRESACGLRAWGRKTWIVQIHLQTLL